MADRYLASILSAEVAALINAGAKEGAQVGYELGAAEEREAVIVWLQDNALQQAADAILRKEHLN